MNLDMEKLPRRLFVAAIITVLAALVLIATFQIWIQAARPESPTVAANLEYSRLVGWLSALNTICIQAIFASIVLCLGAFGLNATRRPVPAQESAATPSQSLPSPAMAPAASPNAQAQPTRKIVIK